MDPSPLSFENALTELETIVRQMESGSDTLESAMQNYERGMQLRQHCAARLEEARLKVEQVTRDAEGQIGLEPFV